VIFVDFASYEKPGWGITLKEALKLDALVMQQSR